jgi:hypothetical protein
MLCRGRAYAYQGLDLWDTKGENYDRNSGNEDIPEILKSEKERFKYLLDREGSNAGFTDYQAEGDGVPKERETAVGHISSLAVCSITTYLDTYFDILLRVHWSTWHKISPDQHYRQGIQ